MRYLFLIFALTAIVAGAIGELRVSRTTTNASPLYATDNGDILPIQTCDFHVVVRYPSGKESDKELIVLFDARSRLYIWRLTSRETNSPFRNALEYLAPRSAVVIAGRHLVWFTMFQPTLFLQDSSRQASDLDDAGKQSIREATSQLALLENDSPRQGIQIDIGRQLGNIGRASGEHFFAPDHRVDPGPFPVHVDAVYTGGQWEITIKANLKAKIILNERFELGKVEQFK